VENELVQHIEPTKANNESMLVVVDGVELNEE
jgi:hypothetical protein